MNELKITTKLEYLNILKSLEKQTKYIEFLQPYDVLVENSIVTNVEDHYIIATKNVSNWNKSGAKGKLLKINVTNENKIKIFDMLKKFDSFFFNTFNMKYGETVEYTDFGLSNIAFFNIKGELLFYTITHEGLAFIDTDLNIL